MVFVSPKPVRKTAVFVLFYFFCGPAVLTEDLSSLNGKGIVKVREPENHTPSGPYYQGLLKGGVVRFLGPSYPKESGSLCLVQIGWENRRFRWSKNPTTPPHNQP